MDVEKKEPTFEQLLASLEKRVAKMESGELALEDMIREFENGSKLLRACRARLGALEKKVELLTRDDGAAGVWAEFDPSEGVRVRPAAPPEKPAPRPAPHVADDTVDELPF